MSNQNPYITLYLREGLPEWGRRARHCRTWAKFSRIAGAIAILAGAFLVGLNGYFLISGTGSWVSVALAVTTVANGIILRAQAPSFDASARNWDDLALKARGA